ncbi:AMP-binding protein [Vibrio cholerae]|uniref:AMP-binding protein n=1 Tax=Vibrio cholerae TaxID=666 RepID=UPI000273465F|nr:AMP-binding protein [Vibrio cholerae]GHW84195.1 long-chain-fatty-acid--CoA ligase [Vibrio metoecus]EGQ9325605.1 AMP-binding protein [Vibrio cholerae]EGR0161059.1 AMP-binding protein [Vibrio cholerae]EGR0519988.1 AMP-dependent synthetase [Vibrio cholerae]EGR2511053.1 AMP-dependent synthetase [Vibrio cholerae]
MINEFWDFDGRDEGAIALITESLESVSYEQLESDIISFSKRLPQTRSLVFLSVGNDYNSVVSYLACLKKGYPFLILDIDLDESLKELLFEQYQPNLHIESGNIKVLNEDKHTLHTDLAMMMSTSGTTGSPKLVRLSRDNLSSNARSIQEYLNITPSDVAITTLPMSYSYGLSVINSHLASGACIVLNNDGILTREFWNKVSVYKVSTFSGVPFTFQMLKKLNYQRFKTDSIRYMTQAGGKLDSSTLEYFSGVCGDLNQEFIVMYGQTEASPRISYVPAEQLTNKIGSIGVPIPGGRLEVHVDKVPTTKSFTEGEIVYFGDNVMMGYARCIDDLALGDTQGKSLCTGDIGYFDDDGYFYITGRAKRFIKLFGLRISLDQIDNWLAKKGLEAVSSGNDDGLVVFYVKEPIAIDAIKLEIATEFKLNSNFIDFREIDEIPRKNGGKIDFKKINQLLSN